MVVLKPMMKPAKSNHGGAGIDKCTSLMRRSGATGKKCLGKTRQGYAAISDGAGLTALQLMAHICATFLGGLCQKIISLLIFVHSKI
jgi:hypothetical protein